MAARHVCDDRCTCPVHGTPLIYWPHGDDHACQDIACRYGHGGWPDTGYRQFRPGDRPMTEASEQPRTDSGADDPIGELRWELGARTRQLDQVRKDYRALTEEVITALSTSKHHMTMRGGLPFCECGLSLGGGDASGSFITHILATWKG